MFTKSTNPDSVGPRNTIVSKSGANPGVVSKTPAQPHTFVKIDQEISVGPHSTVISESGC